MLIDSALCLKPRGLRLRGRIVPVARFDPLHPSFYQVQTSAATRRRVRFHILFACRVRQMCILLEVCMRRALEVAGAHILGGSSLVRFRPCPPIVLPSTNECTYSTPSPISKITRVLRSPNASPTCGVPARSTRSFACSDSWADRPFGPVLALSTYRSMRYKLE